MGRERILASAFSLVILVMFLAGSVDVGASGRGSAPEFTLPDRGGKQMSLKNLRGRVVLLDFWATWCGPCRMTMPAIQKWHEKFGKKGLIVLGINIEGRSPQVFQYIDENRYTFTCLFDQGNWQSGVTKLYGVMGIPRSFLIDRRGNLFWAGHPAEITEALLLNALK